MESACGGISVLKRLVRETERGMWLPLGRIPHTELNGGTQMRKSALFALGAMITVSPFAMAQGLDLKPQSAPKKATVKNVKKADRRARVQQANIGHVPTVAQAASSRKLEPIMIAPIVGRTADGLPIAGEWRPYQPNGNGGPLLGSGQDRLFDAFEGAIDVCQNPPMGDVFMANGPLSGGVAPACDFGGGLTGACGDGDTNRWFLGATAFFGGYMQRIDSLADGQTAGTANFLTHAWNNTTDAGTTGGCGSTVTESVIAVTIYGPEVGNIIGTGNPITLGDLDAGFKGGVLLNFGEITGTGGGYLWTNVELDGDLALDLANGDAFEVLYLAGTDDGMGGTEILGIADWMQSMLWFPKDADLQGAAPGAFYIDGGADPGDCSTFGIGNGDPDDPATPFYDANEAADFTGGLPGGCPDAVVAMVGFYGGAVVGTPGEILSCTILLGSDPQNNGCDPLNLAFDDDNVEQYRSQPGFSALEPDLAEVRYLGNTNDGALTTMTGVLTRDNSDTPNTVGKVRARNFTNNSLANVGIYNLVTANGLGNDGENTTPVADGANFVDANSNYEVRIRFVAPAVFSLLGFRVWQDQVTVFFN